MDFKDFKYEMVVPNEDLPCKFFIFEGRNGNYRRANHWHQSVEIFLVLEGSLKFYVDSQSQPLNAGELIIVNSNEIHSIEAPDPNLTLVLQIPASYFAPYMGEQDYAIFVSQSQEKNHSLAVLIEEMYHVYTKKEKAYLLKMQSLFYELLYQMATDFMKTEADEGTLRQKRHLDRLSQITSYMKNVAVTCLLIMKCSARFSGNGSMKIQGNNMLEQNKKGEKMERRLFTSESVTEGHPDKMCDAISDAILDALMEQDPMSRVACETATTTGLVVVMGEITTKAYVDIQKIVRETIREIGYDRAKYGFDCDTCGVLTAIDEQSADIALGVDKALEAKQAGEKHMSEEELDAIGAGDQGMMFGFATNETEEYMPYPIAMAHKLARRLTEVRKNGTLKYLRPDGKTQVTVEYDENDKPVRLDAVVLSTQHDENVTQEQIHEDIKKYVFDEILPADMVDENTKFFINPTGRFVIGGPHGDSGLTGRKIIVDTYGGYARHGGGAFSGKDCTKVDRSAAYAARYVAKNIVAAGLADKCEIQLSYAIGVAHPTSIMVDTFGTGKVSNEKLVEIIRENFDLRPAGIIKMLDLRRPIYKQTAAYGHFGRHDIDLPWEKLDRAEDLKKYL